MSSEDAARYEVIESRFEIEPTYVLTGRGRIAIREVWLEKRPHPDVKRKLGDKDPKIVEPHYLLCFRTDDIPTPLDGIKEGVWFSEDREWHDTSTGVSRVMNLKLSTPPSDSISVCVIQVLDLKLEGKKIIVPNDKGIRQTIKLKKKTD